MADPSIALKAPFIFKSIEAALCAVMLFGSTGLAVLRVLRIASIKPGRETLAPWLIAPAIGMGTFGPFSLLFLYVFGFSRGHVLLAWAVFLVCVSLPTRFRSKSADEDLHLPAGIPALPNAKSILLIAGAMMWAVIPTLTIYPSVHNGALFVNNIVFDHVKVAMLDGVAREGLPLKNPFYAPTGQRILLSYSYGWYVMGAELKSLAHTSGWQAEVAITWYTGFATMAFLSALASGLSGKLRAGLAVILLASTGPIARNVLPGMLGGRWFLIFGLTSAHDLELPCLQFGWAPQHAFAGLMVCVLVWLISAVLAEPRFRVGYVCVIGLIAASAFETSTWVGCVAVIAASPVVLLACAMLRLPRQNYLTALKSAIPAGIICAAIAVPVILGLFSGPEDFQSTRAPIGLGLFPSTYIATILNWSGVAGTLLRIFLFWFHLLPLCFGVIYVFGILAMIDWLPQKTSERVFRSLALGTTVGFLLVSLFIKSTIAANDLGWRAANVPVMLLLIWAGLAMSSLSSTVSEPARRWRTRARLSFLPKTVLALGLLVVSLGLLSVSGLVRSCLVFPKTALRERRLFAQQPLAWQIVRRYTLPTDLVQSNPDGFRLVTPWPINMPAHLFADRPMAYACTGTGMTYAFRYPRRENHHQYQMVQNIFVTHPTRSAIRQVHDKLRVKAIVVTPEDDVWKSTALEKSGFYRQVAKTDSFKVYIAKT